ncbi:MAG TPA: KPN_01571 family protein [Scandinavium sp.]|nr:KPN_01571 family protein [Scandinavium sp.]HEX4502661.1 KPN_01571 family protein [Scandinavium sp.]
MRQTMNPFIWIFITLLSIDAVRDMAGLTTFLGQW